MKPTLNNISESPTETLWESRLGRGQSVIAGQYHRVTCRTDKVSKQLLIKVVPRSAIRPFHRMNGAYLL